MEIVQCENNKIGEENKTSYKNENINTPTTLSGIPYFHQKKAKNKWKTLTNYWEKSRYIIRLGVKSVFFQTLVLVISFFSMFEKEVLIIFLPKSCDFAFDLIMQCIFYILFSEFLFLVIGKKNYIFSFEFFTDLISLFSSLYEAATIWYLFIEFITGEKYDIKEIVSLVNLAKTSEASNIGAKVTKHIKLLKLMNYIKVVRIAKIVNKAKILNFSFSFSPTEDNKNGLKNLPKTVNDKLNVLGIRFKRGPLIGTNEDKEQRNLSINRLSFEEKMKTNNVPNVFSIGQEEEKQNVNFQKKRAPIVLDLNVLKTIVENVEPKEDKMKKSFLSSENDSLRNKAEFKNNNTHKQIIVSDRKFSKSVLNPMIDKENLGILKEERLSSSVGELPFQKDDDKYPSTSENDKSCSLKLSTFKDNYSSIISDDPDDYMNEAEEKKIKTRINLFRSVSLQIKLEGQKRTSEEVVAPEKENEVPEVQSKNISHKLNSKIEKTLVLNVSKETLTVVLFCLVIFPIFDIEFFTTLIYYDNSQIDRHELCISLLFLMMNQSIYDDTYLKPLNDSMNFCLFNSNTEGSIHVSDALLYISFNESEIFYQLNNKSKLFDNPYIYLGGPEESLEYLEDNYRKKYDYVVEKLIFDDNNNVTYYYEYRHISVFSSTITIANLFFVSFLLFFGCYYGNKAITNYVIRPLDIIFTKLQLNLKNMDMTHNNYKILDDRVVMENDEDFEIKDIFRNASMRRYSFSVEIPLKKQMINKYGLETYYIDHTLNKFLEMINSSIGKLVYPMIPHANLDEELKLDLKTPFIEYEGYMLVLKIRNTEELLLEYGEISTSIISKIYTIFHSLGIIFLGEPYNKNNLHGIIWRKERTNWYSNSSKYSLNLIKVISGENPNNLEKSFDSHKDNCKENNEVYNEICADLSIFCGVKFLSELLRNLRKTFDILQECKVEVNLFATSGKFYEGFLGNENHIETSCFSSSIQEILTLSAHTKIDYKFPSLFISSNTMNHLCEDLKNYIFPYETFLIKKENKTVTLYRHYFNYVLLNKCSEDTNIDYFNYRKLRKKLIYQKRKDFESHMMKNNGSFINFVISDDTYTDVVSGLRPNFRSLMNLAHESFKEKDVNKSLLMIKDLVKMMKEPVSIEDPVFEAKTYEFVSYLKEVRNSRQCINYTKII